MVAVHARGICRHDRRLFDCSDSLARRLDASVCAPSAWAVVGFYFFSFPRSHIPGPGGDCICRRPPDARAFFLQDSENWIGRLWGAARFYRADAAGDRDWRAIRGRKYWIETE